MKFLKLLLYQVICREYIRYQTKIAFTYLNNSLRTDKAVLFTDTCTSQVIIVDKKISYWRSKELKSVGRFTSSNR